MNSSTTARCTDFRTVKDWGRSSTRCDTARVSTQVFVNTVFGGSIFFVLADDADFHERLRRSAYLAKVRVAGSNLVVRSTRTPCSAGGSAVFPLPRRPRRGDPGRRRPLHGPDQSRGTPAPPIGAGSPRRTRMSRGSDRPALRGAIT